MTVAATNFDRSDLLYAESVGPTCGYVEMAFQAIAVTDGVLSGTATVLDPTDGRGFNADVSTYPTALLRVAADPRSHTAEISVTD